MRTVLFDLEVGKDIYLNSFNRRLQTERSERFESIFCIFTGIDFNVRVDYLDHFYLVCTGSLKQIYIHRFRPSTSDLSAH